MTWCIDQAAAGNEDGPPQKRRKVGVGEVKISIPIDITLS
jgi:hypothetical protein